MTNENTAEDSSREGYQAALPSKRTLSEQVADLLARAILEGKYPPGNPIPTEPELSRQFGVSRAVVRDAARILLARGLVDIRHGKGMYVTEPENAAFGDALSLALRRAGASVWDVEEVERILLPEVVALAAVNATDEQRGELARLGETYIEAFRRSAESGKSADRHESAGTGPAGETLMRPFREFTNLLFRSTGNRLFAILAEPLIRLRSVHEWEEGEEEVPAEEAVELEARFHRTVLAAVESRSADEARRIMAAYPSYPPEAVKTLRETPFGEIPVIRLSLRSFFS